MDIIICSSTRDCLILRKSIYFLYQNIENARIYILTARSNFRLFPKRFLRKYNVHPIDELEIVPDRDHLEIAASAHFSCKYRFGWYYQQFLKMGFALSRYADKEYPLNRLYDMNTAGGALLDVGIYPVTAAFAMVESFLGSQGEEKKLSPDLIQNTCRKAFTGVDAFDSISMQFGNIQVHLSCSIDTECGGQLKSAKIVGTKGTIYMPLFWMGEEAYILSLDGEQVESCTYPFGINGYEYEIEEFCRCIQLRWQGEEIRESPLHTHRQSLRVMKALDTIRENIGLEYPFEKRTHKIKESARILTPTGISGELNFDDKKIVVYTDGGCSGNPGAGGWGCVILAGGEEFTAAGGEINTTNNRMELSAAIAALSAIEQNEKWKNSPITVYIDSQYVKNGITSWIRSWKKNGWKNSEKQPVKNRDLWEALDALNSALNVSWQWVKGHAGNKYNEICDALAKAEVEKYSK